MLWIGIQHHERMLAVKNTSVDLNISLPDFHRYPVQDARKSLLVLYQAHYHDRIRNANFATPATFPSWLNSDA